MRKLGLLILLAAVTLSGCVLPEVVIETEPPNDSSPQGTSVPEMTPASAIQSPTSPSEISASPLPPVDTPTSTIVLPPTETPTPAPTSTPAPPTATPTPATIIYSRQYGSPVTSPNLFHSELACGWMGIAGQVITLDGSPATNLVVEVGGTLLGTPISKVSMTGSETMYGAGGYEIKLADWPIESNNTLWLQVFDLENQSVSERVYFNTYADCDQALIIMNFTKLMIYKYHLYLPLIER